MNRVPPSFLSDAFNCAYCHAFPHQTWGRAVINGIGNGDRNALLHDIQRIEGSHPHITRIGSIQSNAEVSGVHFSRCVKCEKLSVWVAGNLVFPSTGEAPEPNPDMPDSIRADYLEASTILAKSPRGAAALMRLAIQKLCRELGKPGKNINDDIGALVKDGLDTSVQKALDAVRVIGNSAVHPGQLDLKDDRATAEVIFMLFNVIVDRTISVRKQIEKVYSSLPPSVLQAIEARDKKAE